jgi:hypothetical protein
MTVAHFTDQTAFLRNNTQDFMDTMFVDEDYTHLQCEACKIDTSGIKKKRREALIQHTHDSAVAA